MRNRRGISATQRAIILIECAIIGGLLGAIFALKLAEHLPPIVIE